MKTSTGWCTALSLKVGAWWFGHTCTCIKCVHLHTFNVRQHDSAVNVGTVVVVGMLLLYTYRRIVSCNT